MIDLFGDHSTSPECVIRRPTNAAAGFAEFWQAWPRGPRKVAKQQCLNKWAKYGCADESSLIVQHVEKMKRSRDWTKDDGAFIPAPLVYLNQRRWEGELPESFDDTSRAAVEALAVRCGMRKWDEISEQWPAYRARVLATCKPV